MNTSDRPVRLEGTYLLLRGKYMFMFICCNPKTNTITTGKTRCFASTSFSSSSSSSSSSFLSFFSSFSSSSFSFSFFSSSSFFFFFFFFFSSSSSSSFFFFFFLFSSSSSSSSSFFFLFFFFWHYGPRGTSASSKTVLLWSRTCDICLQFLTTISSDLPQLTQATST